MARRKQPSFDMQQQRKDCEQAFNDSRAYHRELHDIYKYFMPFRLPTLERSREQGWRSEGDTRTDHLFDGTGLSAAFNFAGTMQSDWMPPLEEFFKLEAGPLVPEDDRKQLNETLAKVGELTHALLRPVHISAHEMFMDIFAGTGAMFLDYGDRRLPIRGRAVPVTEIAIEEGPWGDVGKIRWKRQFKCGHLDQLWPDGKFSDRLAKAMKEDKNADTEIVQHTWWDANEDRWRLLVWSDKDEPSAYIHQRDYRAACPWAIPRFFKVPGERFGRGLAHLGLPFVKTTNKARELALMAAAFAVMGLWIRRNDGVFNPDTAVFAPARMWTVASTGGPLGPSLSRLNVPENFDISNVVIADEREQTRRVLLDDEMPELADRVRSPTEIMGRMRRWQRNKGGTGVRLAGELVTPIVNRAVDILEEKGLLQKVVGGNTKMVFDQLMMQVSITAPAAAAQKQDRAERAVSWIQIIAGMMGPQAALLSAKVEELWPQLGRWLGVDERFIRDKIEREQLQQLLAQMMQAQNAPQPDIPTPTAEERAASYANGALM